MKCRLSPLRADEYQEERISCKCTGQHSMNDWGKELLGHKESMESGSMDLKH